MKASGLLRYKATSICSSVTPSGMTLVAILPSVSPRWIGPYSLPPAIGPAGVTGRLTAGGAAATLGSGAGRDSGTAEITGAGGGAVAALGGSSSAVYSRDMRPEDQSNSTSTSMKGSVTGRDEVILR